MVTLNTIFSGVTSTSDVFKTSLGYLFTYFTKKSAVIGLWIFSKEKLFSPSHSAVILQRIKKGYIFRIPTIVKGKNIDSYLEMEIVFLNQDNTYVEIKDPKLTYVLLLIEYELIDKPIRGRFLFPPPPLVDVRKLQNPSKNHQISWTNRQRIGYVLEGMGGKARLSDLEQLMSR